MISFVVIGAAPASVPALEGKVLNSSRAYLEAEIRAFSIGLPTNSLVLDAGAGDCRYRPLFDQHRYESADFAQLAKTYGDLTYVCDLREIPVEAERFDAVICTQVLAHLSEPIEALKEMRRVLKPGGRLLVTAPFFFQENEVPHDYYRYTKFGLRFLAEKAGLAVTRLDWLEGYYGALAYQMGIAAHVLRAKPTKLGGGLTGAGLFVLALFVRPLFAALKIILDRADRLHKRTDGGHCKNYLMIATRPLKL